MVFELTTSQLDRAAGVLACAAAGDALGAHYEGGAADPGREPQMLGGGYGPYQPGEWTDDTQQQICIARVARRGTQLDSPEALDEIATAFLDWLADGATDVGIGTRAVLAEAGRREGRPGEVMTAVSVEHAKGGRAAGNGALMRTGIVGLTRLNDREATARAAAAVARLTHADQLCVDSCILWSEAVRVAVMEDRLDLLSGLDLLPEVANRPFWSKAIKLAGRPRTEREYADNGYTVSALQAAWHAIKMTEHTEGGGPFHARAALRRAVQLGTDTDTVASIAGALIGARYGAYAIPRDWMDDLHGWPNMTAIDLLDLAQATAVKGLTAQ